MGYEFVAVLEMMMHIWILAKLRRQLTLFACLLISLKIRIRKERMIVESMLLIRE